MSEDDVLNGNHVFSGENDSNLFIEVFQPNYIIIINSFIYLQNEFIFIHSKLKILDTFIL